MQSGLIMNIDIYMRRVHFEMDCVIVYHRIGWTMFEDGIVNAGRLDVMYVLTQTYSHIIQIEPVTSGQPIIGGRRSVMCSIVNQSTARKFDQSEVDISGRLANQKPGKKNQSERRIQKETINRLHRYIVFILKKAETREQRLTFHSTCQVKQKTRTNHWTFRSPWPKGIWCRKP